MASSSEEDAFAALPDDLLLAILALLPSTILRAGTSLISRRWRALWHSVPALDFHSEDFPDPTTYPAVVDHCLSRSAAPTLLRFRADEYETPSPASFSDLDRWFRSAASRRIADLALSFVFDEDKTAVDLPPSIYACSPSLTSLKLTFCGLPSPSADFKGFHSLTSLHLSYMRFTDESLAAVLSACPRLETLSLARCRGLTRIEISSALHPHLKYLNLERVTRTKTKTVVIDAPPSLQLLDFDSNINKLQLVGDTGNVRYAQVMSQFFQLPCNYDDWMHIVSAVAHVQVLSVSCWFFQFVLRKRGNCPALFKNLKELHWLGVEITTKSMHGLISCLRQSPNLEKLIINLDYHLQLEKATREFNDDPVGEADEEMDFEYEYPFDGVMDVLPRLKVFTITQFTEDSCSMQLVEFILRDAIVLEHLCLITFSDELVGLLDPEFSDELVELEPLRKEISSFYCASPHAQVEVSGVSELMAQSEHKIFQHMWSF